MYKPLQKRLQKITVQFGVQKINYVSPDSHVSLYIFVLKLQNASSVWISLEKDTSVVRKSDFVV